MAGEKVVRGKSGTFIEIYDNGVVAALNRLARGVVDMTPVMAAIGGALVASTKERFARSVDPSGIPWKPLSDVTIAKRRKGKGGGPPTPLLDTGRLRNSISFAVPRPNEAIIGTNVEYATTMHFGARMGEFGRYSQVGRVRKYGLGTFQGSAGTKRGFPIPWGNIPPRPFLGVSSDDRTEILDIVQVVLARALTK